jgi:PhnB protein
MIAYEDGPSALEWLARVFGFREIRRAVAADGRLSHGEMHAGEGIIMLATPTPDYESPRHHRDQCDRARKWSEVPYVIDGVLVYVSDVAEHFKHAKSEGALMLSPLEVGGPGARYRVEDLEGHRWMFMERS